MASACDAEAVSPCADDEDADAFPAGVMTTALRSLTAAELAQLEAEELVPTFKQMKLEREAATNWDRFYKRNSTNFFKDRHWTREEFQALCPDVHWLTRDVVLLEVGCGVGNLVFPLLDSFPKLFVYACDFSQRAIDLLKAREEFDERRCKAFVFDMTSDDDLLSCAASVDVATLVFCLSAIDPTKMKTIVRNISQVLKPGGSVLVRDYGLYDHAMLRFAGNGRHKIGERFYVRQDGTRAFYFTLERLNELFADDFDVEGATYVHKRTINRKEGLSVPRVFVQARFIRRGTSPQMATDAR